jgi:dipeptidyl aminopeptidase/acylaminoacyl peptidase
MGSLAYLQNGTLWIKRLPDGTPRALAAGGRLLSPRFSPSGRWILFQDGDDLLRLVSADGRRSKSWQASGDWLPGRDQLVINWTNETNILSENDDWSTPLRTFSEPIGMLSRDGTRHAWTSSHGDGEQLFVGLLSGSGEPRLVAETESGGFQVLSFIRGGSRFLYWATDEDGADVWSYGMDIIMGGGSQPMDTGVETLPANGYAWKMAVLSPVADVLAAAIGGDHLMDHGHSLVLADLSTDSKATVRTLTSPMVTVMDPAWSPDGKFLAWTQAPDSEAVSDQLFKSGKARVWEEVWDWATRQRRIWRAGDGGLGQPSQLTDDDRYADERPIWSSDGRYILFERSDAEDNWSVWLMGSDGSRAREVAEPLGQPGLLLTVRDLFDWTR